MMKFLLATLALLPCSPVFCADEALPPDGGTGHVLGPIPEGQLVGLVGRGHRIRFEGNKVFTDQELRIGLAQSSSVMMAARPTEPMGAFLETLGERLTSGYRNSGCPDTVVRVSYQPENRKHPILVRIEEGERFRQGKIIVRGVEGIDRKALVEALCRGKIHTPEQRMLKRIRDAVEEDPQKLPKPVGGGIQPLEPWGDEEDASWVPGEPVRFQEPGMQPVFLDVLYHLAEQGRAHAQFKTSHERRDGGVADLVIDVADLGPEPVVGQIIIDGARKFERREILGIVGLENGQAVGPRDLEEAMLGLWRSGRFYPFEIDAYPRAPGRAEIDVRIRLQEINDVPALHDPMSPSQVAVAKCIDWINRQMDGDELLVEFDDPVDNGLTLAVGWSTGDGLLLDVQDSERNRGVTLRYSQTGVELLVRDGDRRMAGVIPVRLESNKIRILPSGEEQPLTFSLTSGFVLAEDDHAQDTDIGLLLSPSIPLLKADEFTVKGDQVVWQEGLLTLDLESGMPVELSGGSLSTAAGCVKDRHEQFAKEMTLADELKPGDSDWHEALSSILLGMLAGGPAEALGERFEFVRDLARIADLFGHSQLTGLIGVWIDLLGSGSGAEAFKVPGKFEELLQAGMASVFFETGVLAAIDETFPDSDWPTVFLREQILLLFADGAGVKDNLASVLSDPSVGPLACLTCAKLLEKRAAGLSQEFLRKARDQSGAEGFRNDWRMLIETQSLLKKQTREFWKRLRTLTPEKEEKLGELLGERSQPILRDLLEALRQEGTDAPDEALLAPLLDRLWKDQLEGWMNGYLSDRIFPPADPKTMAATINGAPVPRFLVRLLREQHGGLLGSLPLPESTAEHEWTQDPAVAAAVRAVIALEFLREQDKLPPQERIDEALAQTYPELAGKADAEWVRVTGVTREQMEYWSVCNALVGSLIASFHDIPEDPPYDVLLRHFDAHRALFQSKLSTDIVYVQPSSANPLEQRRCHRLARSMAGTGGEELSLKAIGQLAEQDEEPSFRVFSQTDEKVDMFQLELLHKLEGLKPGDSSESFLLGTGVASVRLRARDRDPSIDLEEVKEIALEHWQATEARRRGGEWFASREQNVVIKLLEDPAPAKAPTLEPMQELRLAKPESVLLQLLDAWHQLGAEQAAERNKAIEWLFAKKDGKDPHIAGMINKGKLDAVRAYLKRAAEANREKADALSLALAQAHAGHGAACKIHETLLNLRAEVFPHDEAPAE